MTKTIIFISFSVFCFQLFAQKENETEPKENRYQSMLPYYNFGRGLGLTSPDSAFQMNIRFRMQNRATYIHENGDDKIRAEVRRLRLRFDGYVGNPKFKYAIQLSFSPEDTGGEIEDGENIQIIRDAVVFYEPNERWNFSFGQTKLPGNRQRMNSSGALQFTDRSINNARFNIDRDFGIQIHNFNQFEDRFSYNFRGAISTGDGRNITQSFDTGLAYTGKVELFPLGAFKNQGSLFEGDLAREEKPKLMLSGAYSFNDNATRTKGQLGYPLYEKRDIHSVFVDAILKYKGWAFQSAYMNRTTNKNPITVNPDDITDIAFVYGGNGMDYQLSYLFSNNYEILGRYSYQQVDKRITYYALNQTQYSIGLTKYFWEHAFKMQAELSYNEYDGMGGISSDDWFVRFQIEMGI